MQLERDRNKLDNNLVQHEQKNKTQMNKISELTNLQMNSDLANAELLTKIRALTGSIGKQQVEIESLTLKL